MICANPYVHWHYNRVTDITTTSFFLYNIINVFMYYRVILFNLSPLNLVRSEKKRLEYGFFLKGLGLSQIQGDKFKQSPCSTRKHHWKYICISLQNIQNIFCRSKCTLCWASSWVIGLNRESQGWGDQPKAPRTAHKYKMFTVIAKTWPCGIVKVREKDIFF